MHRAEAGLEGPRAEVAARVRLAAVGFGNGAIEVEPPVEARVTRVPAEHAVDAVARRDDALRPADASHLAQRGDGIGDVLQHLVRVHDVERRVGMLERVDVTDCELDVAHVVASAAEAAASAMTSADASMPSTEAGATRRAMSSVMVPGPQPTSSTDAPGIKRDARYAAELSTVRQRCERRTLSSWPWV